MKPNVFPKFQKFLLFNLLTSQKLKMNTFGYCITSIGSKTADFRTIISLVRKLYILLKLKGPTGLSSGLPIINLRGRKFRKPNRKTKIFLQKNKVNLSVSSHVSIDSRAEITLSIHYQYTINQTNTFHNICIPELK